MAITVAAAMHAAVLHTHAHVPRTPRALRARKSTRMPGNRLRCAAPAGIEFIIPLGTAPLPDHFRVFAFHGTDRPPRAAAAAAAADRTGRLASRTIFGLAAQAEFENSSLAVSPPLLLSLSLSLELD